MTTPNSDYVDEVLDRFVTRHQGRYLDHSHAYGPQSPDVIEYYVEALLGRPWQFRAGFAARLWDDPQADMEDFVKIQRDEPLRKGDILVFDGATTGTVGIYTGPGSRVGSVQMVTQNPGPVDVIDIMRDGYVHRLLGAWRLTEEAECKAMADRFAEQLNGGDSGKPCPVDRWIEQQKKTMKLDVGDDYGIDPQGEIKAAFDRGFDHAATLPPERRAAVEAWLHAQQGTTPQQRVVETTMPAEPGGHWLKRLFLRGK